MTRRPHPRGRAALASVAALAAVVAGACSGPQDVQVDESDLQGAEIMATAVLRQVSRDGTRVLLLRADTAWMRPDPGETRFLGVRVTSYLPDGASATELRADSARMDDAAGTLVAWGATVVNREETIRFQAPRVTYDLEARRMEARGVEGGEAVEVEEEGRARQVECLTSTLQLLDWSGCT